MRSKLVTLVVGLAAGVMLATLAQVQSADQPGSGRVVEVGKTYQAQWPGFAENIEFKVTGYVDDCWVKVEQTRKSYNFSHLNMCAAAAMRQI